MHKIHSRSWYLVRKLFLYIHIYLNCLNPHQSGNLKLDPTNTARAHTVNRPQVLHPESVGDLKSATSSDISLQKSCASQKPLLTPAPGVGKQGQVSAQVKQFWILPTRNKQQFPLLCFAGFCLSSL